MNSKIGYFVTGTGTGIGKTVSCALLVARLLREGKKVGYWKPVQTGTDSDRNTVLTLSGLAPDQSPPACYEFPEPVAPAWAAALNHTAINLEEILRRWDSLPGDRTWIVEGAGGLLVPLHERRTIADLAALLRLPIVIVAGTGLGTMNHLLLTLEAARSRALPVAGVLWVGEEDPALSPTLAPWIGGLSWQPGIPRLPELNRRSIQRMAGELQLTPRPEQACTGVS